MKTNAPLIPVNRPARQRGLATLMVAMVLLLILSIVVLFGTSVGLFEQRTETNENRAKLAQTAAESALNLGIEFMRANNALVSSELDGGWLAAGTTRWVPCTTAVPSGEADPCLSERDATRRSNMYRYVSGDTSLLDLSEFIDEDDLDDLVGAVSLGNADTDVEVSVSATMCRLDEINPTSTACVLDPELPGLVAVTLVVDAAIDGESAAAQVKETIATFRSIGGAAAVPLVASGSVKGLGNAEIVANPNAGGFGIPASIWSPCPINIEGGAGSTVDPLCDPPSGGIGSVITCHLGEYLDGRPREDLLTQCPFSNNACGCPTLGEGAMSGHSGATTVEGIDILDIDDNAGAMPDITFYPREPYDDPADPLDDSMFEVIFRRDVVDEGETDVSQACDGDCAIAALQAMGAEEIACGDLNADSTGLYWAREDCDLSGQIGSPETPVVLVIEGNDAAGDTRLVQLNANAIIFGMLFVRSSDNTAELKATGGPKIFGMVVVEGVVGMGGTPTIVYSDEIAQNIINSPAFNNFGRLPGSWLDARTSF